MTYSSFTYRAGLLRTCEQTQTFITDIDLYNSIFTSDLNARHFLY